MAAPLVLAAILGALKKPPNQNTFQAPSFGSAGGVRFAKPKRSSIVDTGSQVLQAFLRQEAQRQQQQPLPQFRPAPGIGVSGRFSF